MPALKLPSLCTPSCWTPSALTVKKNARRWSLNVSRKIVTVSS